MIILTLKRMRNVSGNNEPENIRSNSLTVYDKTNQACIVLSKYQHNVKLSTVKQHQQYCFYDKY
jgi:hypothetical protein